MKRRRRRSKQVAAVTPATWPTPKATHVTMVPMFASTADGASSIAAVTEMLQAMTALPSDRAKARVLRFVQDYFDEQHGH